MAGQVSTGWAPSASGIGSVQVYSASSLEGTSASFVRTDATTQGDWLGVYGGDGYKLAGDDTDDPDYATVSIDDGVEHTWDPNPGSSTTRALQRADGSGRVAATWFNTSEFAVVVDVTPTDEATHRISLYLLDWDAGGRTERIDVVSLATGDVLDSRNASDFAGGAYLTWDVRGAVRFRVVHDGGSNAVVSGVFFDQVPNSASASFVRSDATTQGDWIGAYGDDGYVLAGDAESEPNYATVSFDNKLDHVWDGDVDAGETRALQKPDGSGRVASAWFNSSPFEVIVDVTPTDDATHRISLYMVDWDGDSRIVRIEVVDPVTSVVLDSREASQFHDGLYQTWDVRGSVQFRITRVGGSNAVVSGIFFDPVPGTSTAPATPTGVAASAVSDSAVQVTWTASAGADGYTIERSVNGTNWLPLDTTVGTNATSYTDSNLSEGTRFYYRVAATNASGTSTFSDPESAWTRLKAPTGLAAALISASRVGLAWVDVSGLETGYLVERSSDGTNWGDPITTPANATNVTLTGAFSSTTYFRIQAVGPDGRISEWSAPVTSAPVLAAPTNLSATRASATQVNLTWIDNSSDEQSFEVERSSNNGSTWDVATVGPGQTTYSTTGLTSGVTYLFRVRARAASDSSAYSNIVSLSVYVPVGGAPANLAATPLDKDRIGLSWTDSSGELGYEIERLVSGVWTPIASPPADATTWLDDNLNELWQYNYRIRSYDAAGYSSYSYAPGTWTLLAAPSDFVVTFVSPTRVDATWTDRSSMENVGFLVEQSFDGIGGWNIVAGPPVDAVSTSIPGSYSSNGTYSGEFTSGATYHFRIRAVRWSSGVYTYSDYATAVLTIPAFPAKPAGVTATNTGSSIDVAWSDVSNETGYRVERLAAGSSVWMYLDSVGADVTSYKDSRNLADNTQYSYRVTAYNAGGFSITSNDSAWEWSSPTAPEGLRATLVSADRIDMAWIDRSAAETGYRLDWSRDGSTWTSIDLDRNVVAYSLKGSFAAGEKYYFRLIASTGSRASTPVVSSITIPAFPSPPTGLTVTSQSSSSISIAWTPKPGAVAYRVSRRTADGPWIEIGSAANDFTSFTDSTVVAGVVYTYGVAAETFTQNFTVRSGRAVSNFAIAEEGTADHDDDGLSNVDEANLGTDPTYFDTDGDLLPDGWEARYEGFDPKSPTPAQGDADGDGLTNIAEYTHDTDPTKEDTDGDGVSDSAEVASGSDPKDPSDGGVAPADDMKGKFQLTTGDPSGSKSERWELQVGNVKYQSPGYGQVGSGDYFFDAGESYEIRMRHIGTRPDFLAMNGGANYDWTASIAQVGANSVPFWIDDQGELLRTYISSTIGPPNLTEGKVSYLHIPQLDVDVDSDNNGAVDHSKQEDRLERDANKGKVVWANLGDLDDDGVPDFADFDGIAGGHFVPVTVTLSDNIRFADPTSIRLSFNYDASNPADPNLRKGAGTPEDPYVYTAAPGKLRLWKPNKDAGDTRDVNVDYIGSGVSISAADLGLQPGGTITLFVEAVATAASPLAISVTANVAGGKWSGNLTDVIHVSTAAIDLVKANVGTETTYSDVETVPLYRAQPIVTIDSPSGSVAVIPGSSPYQGYINVSGQVEDLIALSVDDPSSFRPVVTVNGQLASLSYLGRGRYSYQTTIEVQAGKNFISVEAENALGNLGANAFYFDAAAVEGQASLVGQVTQARSSSDERTFVGKVEITDTGFVGAVMPATVTSYASDGQELKSVQVDLTKDSDGIWRSPTLIVAEKWDDLGDDSLNIPRFFEIPVGGRLEVKRGADVGSRHAKPISGLAFGAGVTESLQTTGTPNLTLDYSHAKTSSLSVKVQKPDGGLEDWSGDFNKADTQAIYVGGGGIAYGSNDVLVELSDRDGNLFRRQTSLFRYDPSPTLDLLQSPSRKLKATLPVVIGQENGFAPHLQDATVLQFPTGYSDAQKSAFLTDARLEVLAFSPDRDVAYVRSREGRSAMSTSLRMEQSFGAKVMGSIGSGLEYAGAVSWGFVEGGLQGAKGLATGVYQGAKTIVMEPLYVAADDLATGYILAFQPEWADYYEPMSGIRKAVEAGYEPGEIVHEAVVGVAQTPGRFVQALVDGDSDKIGQEYVNLAALVLPFKGSNLSFPSGSIGLIPVGQRMTAGGALAMEYAQVTIRTVTIDGVEIAQGTLLAMSEVTGNVGGGGGVGGGDPTQPSQTNPNAAGSTNLPPDREAKILEGEWVDGAPGSAGDFIGGHAARMKTNPNVEILEVYDNNAFGQGVVSAKIRVTRPGMGTKVKGQPSRPHAFFPDSWTDEMITAALKEVCGDPANFVKVNASDGSCQFRKIVDGILIEGYVRDGQIIGGYPKIQKVPNS
ncbi:fibronectin type III domain-containing protein [Paludisphaera rhizosphaerae]|uniref:fibronectin type III domain-containing protein n=1 Tax=Paludisphaera rhizosphaerae TaxID=2711216 RepID=UPI0013EB2B17|nr:fibronectin type III domain-containing protein [Paludisphaera rhizosphaerae]